jgi:hypothetical protein
LIGLLKGVMFSENLTNIILDFKTLAVGQTHTRCVTVPDIVMLTVLCKYFDLSPEEVELFTRVQGSLIHVRFHSTFPSLR